MAVTSISDRVASLLSLPTVSARTGGAVDTALELTAVGDLVAATLTANPRAALYFVHLARNGLLSQVSSAISVIDEMISATRDLSNPQFVIQDSTDLMEVRSALLNMESSGFSDQDNYVFEQLRTSVARVLDKGLAGSVRRGGKFVRPSQEALADLTAQYQSLRSLHTDIVDRVSALPVAYENFASSGLQKTKSSPAVTRFRAEVEGFLDELSVNGEVPADRNLALSLLTGKSAIEHVSKIPSARDPVVSTTASLPRGYVVSAATANTAAEVLLPAGPYDLSSGATVSISDASGSVSNVSFPQSASALGGLPFVVGSAVSWPVTVPSPGTPPTTTPPEAYQPALLFLVTTGSGTLVKAVNLTPGTYTLAQVITAINAVSGLAAHEFVQGGSNRLRVSATSGTQIRVLSSYAVRAPASYNLTTYKSAHGLFGFSGEEVGTTALPTLIAAEALNIRFGSYLTATALSDGTIRLVGKRTEHGAFLTFSGPPSMGGTRTGSAKSNTVRLFGSVFGESADPVSPVGVVSVGHLLSLGSGESSVVSLTPSSITLEDEIPTYSGNVVITSPLVAAHDALVALVDGFLVAWRASEFFENLDSLDRSIASCTATRSPAQQAVVVASLNDLRGLLSDLKAALEDASTAFSANASFQESEIADDILETLRQRGMDRVSDFLLRAKILEGTTLVGRSTSYSGNAELAMISVARNDIAFPNRAVDEGLETSFAGSGE